VNDRTPDHCSNQVLGEQNYPRYQATAEWYVWPLPEILDHFHVKPVHKRRFGSI
jgi:hypothetical protein